MEFEISLNNLIFFSYHGIYEEEKQNGNEFRVSLSVIVPYSVGMEDDEISKTVSYADLYEIIREEMAIPRNLLEKLSLRIVKRIKKEYPVVTKGKLCIEKVRPPVRDMLGSASVSLIF